MQKLALITGTGSGIGKSLAKLLLNNNYKVIGYSRTNKILHPNFSFIKIDLSNLAATERLVFPKANESNVLLVNNAATIGTIIILGENDSDEDTTSTKNDPGKSKTAIKPLRLE